jgi:hypothetical protein
MLGVVTVLALLAVLFIFVGLDTYFLCGSSRSWEKGEEE